MQITWAQIFGIARYEVLMAWRRGGLAIVTVGICGLMILTSLLLRIANYGIGANLPPWVTVSVSDEIMLSTTAIAYAMLLGMTVLIWGLPFFTSETIPLDQKFRVDDLLDALPVTHGAYLAGKVLGVWLSVIAGIAFSALIYGIAVLLLHGRIDLPIYLLFWGLGPLPMGLFVSGCATLIGALISTRRGAVLAAIPVPIFAYTAFVLTFLNSWLVLVHLLRPHIDILLFTLISTDRSPLIDYGNGLLVLAAVGILVWSLLRRRSRCS